MEEELGRSLSCEERDARGIDVEGSGEVEGDEVRTVEVEDVARCVGDDGESSKVDFTKERTLLMIRKESRVRNEDRERSRKEKRTAHLRKKMVHSSSTETPTSRQIQLRQPRHSLLLIQAQPQRPRMTSVSILKGSPGALQRRRRCGESDLVHRRAREGGEIPEVERSKKGSGVRGDDVKSVGVDGNGGHVDDVRGEEEVREGGSGLSGVKGREVGVGSSGEGRPEFTIEDEGKPRLGDL